MTRGTNATWKLKISKVQKVNLWRGEMTRYFVDFTRCHKGTCPRWVGKHLLCLCLSRVRPLSGATLTWTSTAGARHFPTFCAHENSSARETPKAFLFASLQEVHFLNLTVEGHRTLPEFLSSRIFIHWFFLFWQNGRKACDTTGDERRLFCAGDLVCRLISPGLGAVRRPRDQPEFLEREKLS